jgi:hypothetical protein
VVVSVVVAAHAKGNDEDGCGGQHGNDGNSGLETVEGGEESGHERADGEAAVPPEPVDPDGTGPKLSTALPGHPPAPGHAVGARFRYPRDRLIDGG